MGATVQEISAHIGRPPLLLAPSIGELAARYRGQDIAIVGNGPTGNRDLSDLSVPIWAISTSWIRHRYATLCFMMDDLRGPAWDIVPSLGPQGMKEDLTREQWEPIVRLCPVPIVTARAYPEFPQTVEYPLADVEARFGRRYFSETLAFAIAWAVHIGVKSIRFVGCDFDGVRPAERAGAEYWIGRAEEAGIPVDVVRGSQLLQTGPLDGKNRHIPGLYGYTSWSLPLPKGSELSGLPQLAGEEDGRTGHLAMAELLKRKDLRTVLDVGCGPGTEARLLADAGFQVTGTDPNANPEWHEPFNHGRMLLVQLDYMEAQFAEPFDAIWCSHVLEHVENPSQFLRKMHAYLREGGLLVLTLPPAQHLIVGGHLSLWNAGELLYHLVRAGFDCRHARVKQYGYNFSVIVEKRTVPEGAVPALPNFQVERIREFLPDGLEWTAGAFNGDIRERNWNDKPIGA